LSSDEIDQRAGRYEGWTAKTYLIESRAVASPQETTSLLGAIAGRQALAAAGWEPGDLDVIVGACAVMEQPIPGVACMVQRHLGLGGSGIPAFDVNATCLSFLVALDTVSLAFAAGRWRRALIVSADIASAALDFSDPEASVIFGDGAAAVAVEAVDDGSGLLGWRLETYGDGADLCRLEAGGARLRPHDDLAAFMAGAVFKMDGFGVFKATAKHFPRFLDRLLEEANVAPRDIDIVTPHQASAAALEHLRRALPAGVGPVIDIFADHGNQIAASMPTALHAAIASGQLQRGQTALLVGTAAGVSLGGAVLRY
jgi:3-oxoacyl-[acyl-carrier-protein] synthase III